MAEKTTPDYTNSQNKKRRLFKDNSDKNITIDDIILREQKIKDQIRDCYQEIYLQEDIIYELKIKLESLETEKCGVLGHIWIPDKSYGSYEGEEVCERCQIFNRIYY